MGQSESVSADERGAPGQLINLDIGLPQKDRRQPPPHVWRAQRSAAGLSHRADGGRGERDHVTEAVEGQLEPRGRHLNQPVERNDHGRSSRFAMVQITWQCEKLWAEVR